MGDHETLAAIAGELGVSPQQVALAWHLTRYEDSRHEDPIPIPGVSKLGIVEDSAKGADVWLTGNRIARLDAAFA